MAKSSSNKKYLNNSSGATINKFINSKLFSKIKAPISILIFALVGYSIFSIFAAVPTGTLTTVGGQTINTNEFVRRAAPQIYLVECTRAERQSKLCFYRFYIVPPKLPAGVNRWEYYNLASEDKSIIRKRTDIAEVNGKFDTMAINENYANHIGRRFYVRFARVGPDSEMSNYTVAVPPFNYVGTTTGTTGTTGTGTTGSGSESGGSDDESLGDDGGLFDSGDEASFDEGISFDLSDLGDIGLDSYDLDSISEGIDDYGLDNESGDPDSTASASNPKLTNYGYRARLFCVKKIDKKTSKYKIIGCNNATHIFLGISGKDQAIKKKQLTYNIRFEGEKKARLAVASGCTQKTLSFTTSEGQEKNVQWCAITWAEKPIITNVRDNAQSRFRSVISRLMRRENINPRDLSAYNLRKVKNNLENKKYSVYVALKGYSSTKIGSGYVKFNLNESKTATLIIALQKANCEKANGEFNHNQCKYPAESFSKSKLYRYEFPDNLLAQQLLSRGAK